MIFRRNTVQVRNEGGLWDESMKLYPDAGGSPREHELFWKFPNRVAISFNHLQHETSVLDHQGAQYPFIGWDELTHFSAPQFWYLISRNRSTCGIRPYVRATCNPDADSWVAKLIEWWIDPKTGYPIPERSGVIRWFIRLNDTLIWGDEPQDLAKYRRADGQPIPPKSLTFIAARLEDNKALMEADPGYVANLLALSSVERERLHGGNWLIRASGNMFKREWFEIVDEMPATCGPRTRSWDIAATEPSGVSPDPDWTAGVKGARCRETKLFYIEDVTRDRVGPTKMMQLVKTTASQDGRGCSITVPKDPAQAGKTQADTFIKELAGYDVEAIPPSGDKEVRARPAAAQAGARNIKLLRGPWNEAFIDEACGFPGKGHDDQVDALSDLIAKLALGHGPATITKKRM